MDSKIIDSSFLKTVDVHKLLPQQEPFLMIGNIKFYSDECFTTETYIDNDNVLVEDGFFEPYGLIENIAQSCAAHIEFKRRYIDGLKDIVLGYIGSIKSIEIFKLPVVNSKIITNIKVVQSFLNMRDALATVTDVDGNVLVSGEIIIAQSNEKADIN